MAVSTVSTVDRDEWQLITSVTPSGTSVTFNSFSGYKHLWLVGKGVTKSATDSICVRPNNDTTAGNYAYPNDYGRDPKFLLTQGTSTATAFTFAIYDVDKSIPHKVDVYWDSTQPSSPTNAYVNPAAVTSLVVYTLAGSATFSGGTLYLYGIAV